jgi:hypothetical protein
MEDHTVVVVVSIHWGLHFVPVGGRVSQS